MSNYIPFTKEEQLAAGSKDIVEILSRMGEEVKRVGNEYVWMHECEKVTIRGNLWYNQYQREGGNSIDFMRKFYKLSYPEAVSKLLGKEFEPVKKEKSQIYSKRPFETKKDEAAFLPPKRNSDMRRVFAYLIKTRKIDPDVVTYFAAHRLIYEEAEYHNAVFCGTDEKGIMCHANKRGTDRRKSFKGNQAGSLAECSFHIIGKSDTLYFFEAPIDMLSYISLNKENWKQHSYAAACSVSDKVLYNQLKLNPHIKKCVLCLDNDEAGIKAGERIKEKLIKKGYEAEFCYPKAKDWNEELMSRIQKKEELPCQAMRY